MTDDAYVGKVFFLRHIIQPDRTVVVTENYATGNGDGLALNVEPKGPVVAQKWIAKRVAGKDTVTIINVDSGLGWTQTGGSKPITLSASPSEWLIVSRGAEDQVFVETPPPNQHQRWSAAVPNTDFNASVIIRVDEFRPLPPPPPLWVFETAN